MKSWERSDSAIAGPIKDSLRYLEAQSKCLNPTLIAVLIVSVTIDSSIPDVPKANLGI